MGFRSFNLQFFAFLLHRLSIIDKSLLVKKNVCLVTEWEQRRRAKVLGSQFALPGKLNYLSTSTFTYPKGDTDWISGLKCRSLMILNTNHKRWILLWNNTTFPSMKKTPLCVWMFCIYTMFWMCVSFSNICQVKTNLQHKLSIPYLL